MIADAIFYLFFLSLTLTCHGSVVERPSAILFFSSTSSSSLTLKYSRYLLQRTHIYMHQAGIEHGIELRLCIGKLH